MLNIRRRFAVACTVLLLTGHIQPAYALDVAPTDQTQGENAENSLERYALKKQLTDDELVDVLRIVGFEGPTLKVAYAVVKKESNGRPKAHNDNVKTGDNSYGIFQINMLGELGEQRREKYGLSDNSDLFDPITNAEIAYKMSNKGKVWTAWKVHKGKYNGTRYEAFYKNFMEVCLVPLPLQNDL
jgi:hypothetical protein